MNEGPITKAELREHDKEFKERVRRNKSQPGYTSAAAQRDFELYGCEVCGEKDAGCTPDECATVEFDDEAATELDEDQPRPRRMPG